jgi:hypothetical protein
MWQKSTAGHAGASLASDRSGDAPGGASVPNYLVYAILTTVFCCLPTGIPAIIYASQVNTKLQLGDVAGAQASSNNAKMWCWISLGLGLLTFVGYGLVVVLGIVGRLHSR